MENDSFFFNPAFQLLLFASLLIPAILFLLTEFNTLRLIKRSNRVMQPGWVWLQLIPLVGQVWQFVVVARIARSIGNQWHAAEEDSILGITAEAVDGGLKQRPTLVIGIAYCVLNVLMICCNIIVTFGHIERLEIWIGFLVFASVPCWIVYWIKLAIWKRRLKQRAALVTG